MYKYYNCLNFVLCSSMLSQFSFLYVPWAVKIFLIRRALTNIRYYHHALTHMRVHSHTNTHTYTTPTHNYHYYYYYDTRASVFTVTPIRPHTITCCRWQGPGRGWCPPMVAHHHDVIPVGQSPCQLMVGDGLALPRPCQHLDAVLVGPRGRGQGVERAEVIRALRHSGCKVTRPGWSLGVCWGIRQTSCRRMTGIRC